MKYRGDATPRELGTGVVLMLGLVAIYVPDEGFLVDVRMAFDIRIVRELSWSRRIHDSVH